MTTKVTSYRLKTPIILLERVITEDGNETSVEVVGQFDDPSLANYVVSLLPAQTEES